MIGKILVQDDLDDPLDLEDSNMMHAHTTALNPYRQLKLE